MVVTSLCGSHIVKPPVRMVSWFFPSVPAQQQHTHTTMKETLKSLLRHALTALAGAGVLLTEVARLATEAAANGGGIPQQDVLLSMGKAAAMAVLTRMAMKAGGKIFPSDDNGVKNTGGNTLLVLGLVGLVGCALPACSSPGGMEPVPVRASYKDKKGNVYAYDPQTGVSVMLIEGSSGK